MALTTHPSLLQRVKDPKDGKSWREFFGIYEPLLCQYARRRGLDREMAEEVAQQCMASLVEKMPGFEYSRERGGFKLWLQRVANNKINDYFKKKKLPLAEGADLRAWREREVSSDELWDREWQKKHLMYCLNLVRDEVALTTYQAFEYHVLVGWPVERVVEALDISADQVYAAKSRMTRRLRAKMRELLGEEA